MATVVIWLHLLQRSGFAAAADIEGLLSQATGNPTALNDQIAPAWADSPSYRGTSDILWSCIVTLAACIYTSMHLNIPFGHRSIWQRVGSKIKWAATALVAPELVLFTALRQRLAAGRLCKTLNEIKNELDSGKDVEEGQSASPKDSFTLEYGFWVLIGGFVVDTRDMDDDDDRYILSKEGVILLAQLGRFLDMPNEQIMDRSKANFFAKLLVCTQVTWMAMQCIVRRVAGYPITLLEIHTMVHVVCALCFYILWWHKPLDVEMPVVVNSEALDGAFALMLMENVFLRSSFYPADDLQEIELVQMCSGGHSVMVEVNSTTGEISRNAVTSESQEIDGEELERTGTSVVHSETGNLASQDIDDEEPERTGISVVHSEAGNPASREIDDEEPERTGTSVVHSEAGNPRNAASQEIDDEALEQTGTSVVHSEPGGRPRLHLDDGTQCTFKKPEYHRSKSFITLKTGELLECGMGPRAFPETSISIELTRKDVRRWELAANFLKDSGLYSKDVPLDVVLQETPAFNGIRDSLIPRRMPNLVTGKTFLLSWESDHIFNAIFSEPQLLYAMLLLPLVYGGVHLSAWDFSFPSVAENVLWKVCCIGIIVAFPIMACCVRIYGKLRNYSRFYFWFLSEPIPNAICLAGFTLYAFFRTYIVLEAFLSLRHVPIGVYLTVPWVQSIPHL